MIRVNTVAEPGRDSVICYVDIEKIIWFRPRPEGGTLLFTDYDGTTEPFVLRAACSDIAVAITEARRGRLTNNPTVVHVV